MVLDFAEVVVYGWNVLDHEVWHSGAEPRYGGVGGAFVPAKVPGVCEAVAFAPLYLRSYEVFEKELSGEGVEAHSGFGRARHVFNKLRQNRGEGLPVAPCVFGVEDFRPWDAMSGARLVALVVGVNHLNRIAEKFADVFRVFFVCQGYEKIGCFARKRVHVAVEKPLCEAQRGRAARDCCFVDAFVCGGGERGETRGVGIRWPVGEIQAFLAQVGAFFLDSPAGIPAGVSVFVVEPDGQSEAFGAFACV